MYYHVRHVLNKLQVPLSHEAGFNAADSPHTNDKFFKICEDCNVAHDPMRHRDQNFIGLINEA